MIKRNDNNFVQRIEDEIIIHSVSTGNNIFLNETASEIYEAIADGITIEELLKKLSDIYNIETALILQDVHDAIDAMVSEGVLYFET